ncbi:MAG: hypothetical protein ACK4WA_03050 [Chitinophagales bacterium]|jgi:hypothetical protein
MIKYSSILLILFFAISCKNSDLEINKKTNLLENSSTYTTQSEQLNLPKIDTIDFIKFKNKLNGYFLLHSKTIDSLCEKITIFKNKEIIGTLRLPIPDEELKNFQLIDLKELDNGIEIHCAWGGGEDIYEYKLYLELINNTFYLNKTSVTFSDGSTKNLDDFNMINVKNIDLLQILEY